MRARDVLIVALLSSVVGAGCGKLSAQAPPPAKLDEVVVTLPTTDTVTDYEDFIGHTDAMFSVDVRARVSGILDRVNFTDGDEVEKDKLLFKIDPRPYQATFDSTTAALEQGFARLTRTTADHRRAEALMKRNAIGQEEYDRIQGDYAETKAAIGSAKAALDMASLNLGWTDVTAPIAGRLSRRMVDPGNLVKADDTILTSIVSLDPMYVNFDIDERTLLKIRRLIAAGKAQSRAEAELPLLIGLSDEVDFPHSGVINFSDNKLDSSTGTLRLRGTIGNPRPAERKPRLLSPGLFVRVRLPVGQPHKSIMISEEAIGTDQGNKFVYVIERKPVKLKDKDGKEVTHEGDVAIQRPIKVGSYVNGLRVVDSGLKEGEKVIVGGLQRVRKNKEVAFKFAADLKKAEAAKPDENPAHAGTPAPSGSPRTTISLSDSAPLPAAPAPSATK